MATHGTAHYYATYDCRCALCVGAMKKQNAYIAKRDTELEKQYAEKASNNQERLRQLTDFKIPRTKPKLDRGKPKYLGY